MRTSGKILFHTVTLIFVLLLLGCSKPATRPAPASQAASSKADDSSPWRLQLTVSPNHPSMTKPVSFLVHITDQTGHPVDGALVNGALAMKLMDMGITHIKFAPKGNGDYEAPRNDIDMSGPWDLEVDVAQGTAHMKKSFDVTVYD